MPGRDQAGPSGEGPMTGRATGRCDTSENKVGRGRGMGRGAGRGMGRGRAQGFGPQNSMADLEKRLAALEGK